MAKQIKVREDNYFAVQGWMVTELKLKGNALMLYAIIYGFSQTTNTAFTGSVDYLCEWLGGVSRPTVINTLDNLVKQGLLTKSSTTKGALIYNSYTALRPSKKILSDEDPTSKKTLPDTSKNFLLNKDSKDNIEKSISKEMEGKAPKKKSYSTILEDPVNKFVKEALSKFIQYCRGKNYTPSGRDRTCLCKGESCEFCKSGNKPQLRMFLQMINKDEKDKDKQVQLWERGLTDIKNLIGLAGEYGDLTKRDIKIKRSGAKGSLKTTYQYFPKDPSEMEIPEPQNLVGSLILDLDREDQIKAIEGRLQLNKGNNNDSNNDSGAGATRVF